ncbi:MAG: hypothetical protein ACO1TE_21435 [Prosthecobacter sp.]
MKAPRDLLLQVSRVSGLAAIALLLCQCQLPPRQAWQYIRSNGLLTYWNYEASRPSPPFGAGAGYSQRYASARSTYTAPRYGSRPSTYWSSYARPTSPVRTPYLAPSTPATRYPGRVYAAPSPRRVEERVEPSRPAPAPRVSPRPRAEPPSVARIPVDEPTPTPPVVRSEPPAPSVASKSNGAAPAPVKPAASTADLPYGTSVPGRPNMVNSPYAGKTQLVDVSGMTSGQTVKCPYTGKLFKVPSSQQATNNAEPKLESKMSTPKMSSEPKAEDKKP